MLSNLRLTTLFFAPVLAATVGCSSGTSFSSGVDGSKKASELSEADVKAICDAAKKTAEDFAKNNEEALCNFSGGLAGVLASAGGGGDPVALCEAAVTECKNAPFTTDTDDCNPKVDGCDVTVAEIETCFNDSLEVTEKAFDAFAGKSCSELTSGSTFETAGNIEEPASCKAIDEKCPDISFGEPSVGGNGSDD